MQRYYTRACNFYFGNQSKILVKKKKSIPLHQIEEISFDNIEIILIGKDAEQIHGENSSKSIRKTIDSVSELDQNSKSISMRGTQKTTNFTRLEKRFFQNNRGFKEKIHDSVLPNIVDYIDLIDKSPSQLSAGDSLFVNYTLSSHKKTDEVQVNSNNVLFYDEVYDNYIFNQFLDNNEFAQKRSIQKSIKGTLESKIDYNSFNLVNTHLAFSKRGVMFSAKNKYKDYDFNPLFFMPESFLYGSNNLIRYTLPSYNSDKNNSTLDVINDNVFKFKSSNQNYGVDLSNANEFVQCSVTIQKHKNKYYIVLHPGTNSALLNAGFYVLVNQLKSLDGLEMIDTPIGNQYFVRNSKHSNLTLPLTLRSLITYDGFENESIEVGRDESSGFTKEFVLVEPNTIQEESSCFVALLEDWELVNIVNPYNSSLPAEQQTSNRSEVPEILFTNGVYSADCLIKSIVDEFVSYASEWDNDNGYDYFGEISDNNTYENENNSFITLSTPSMEIGLSSASQFLSHAGRRINVEFHLTKYKLKRSSGTLSDTGNIYKNKNLIGENYSRPFSERGKFLYSDDNIFETNFSIKKKIHDNVGKEINKIPEFINNEVIYHTECFYVASADSTIEKIRKTDYDIIFKYLDFSHNGINFPQIFIYDIFSKKNKVKDYKAGNNFNSIFSYLELPESGFLRVYEPRIYEQYKLGFIKPDIVPYFQINLSDFTIALQNRKEPEDFDQEPVGLSTMSNEHILLDASAYQTSNNENYQDIEFSYGAWGSIESKDRFVNDIIYTYGKNYNFPVYEKKGYVYGVQSSSPLSAETYFNKYRYGHFSDHIKYTKNYVTTRNVRTRQILSYTVQKTFYNSTFEVVDNSNLTQTYNNNHYAQSNYPFIENIESELSQTNFDHPLYDGNFVY